MADQEETQEPESQPPKAQTPDSPASSGHGEPEPDADPLAALTSPGKELLGASLEVLKNLSPEAGALNDIPQVSVDKEHTLEACRLMKADPRICLLYTSPSPRDLSTSRMPSSA